MKFISIDGQICVVTHFTLDEEVETENIGSPSGGAIIQKGRFITGEMFVFRKGSLPDLFSRDGMPNRIDVEFVDNEKMYSLDGVMFTSFREMSNAYDKCEAAYTEYVAESIDVSQMVSQTIKVGSTL
jgi:hypothetical protein